MEDEDGQPLYSWRVVLLPFLGEEALYREFHLDEPWDSPHNYALLARMPEVYAAPGARTQEPYGTFYQFVVGDATVFRGPKAPRIPASFPNGTSNTVLLAEAGQDVPWSKPADLSFDPTLPLPPLGSPAQRRILPPARHWGGVHLLKADASVVFIPAGEMPKREPAIRRAIDQTINDWGLGGW